jgi:shikimate dehydrogenase
MEKRITGRTGLMALFGTPVGHSGSPAIYNFSFRHSGLDYVYVAFDVGIEGLKEALSAMRLFKMRGANVTMPCKNIAAELVDDLSPAARIMFSVISMPVTVHFSAASAMGKNPGPVPISKREMSPPWGA